MISFYTQALFGSGTTAIHYLNWQQTQILKQPNLQALVERSRVRRYLNLTLNID